MIEDLDATPSHRRSQDPNDAGPRLDIHAGRVLQLQSELAELAHRVEGVEVCSSGPIFRCLCFYRCVATPSPVHCYSAGLERL